MNVVVLTPDRVGSTLLQRLITIYMQFHKFDQPVINLHELTNGIIKYWSPDFNAEVLGKDPQDHWGYHQTLPEIARLLDSVPHYKTSRLAQYHIKTRQDSLADQMPFYQYLNDNFFIISAQRENLLEHALSWAIYIVSRNLNVYSHSDKFKYFEKIYQNRITVERQNLWKYLDNYLEYLDWVDRHFHVNSYFVYDREIANLERYILTLPLFDNQPKRLSWQDTFDIGFQDWNRCHYLCSDMSGLSEQLDPDAPRLEWTAAQEERLELAPIQTYSLTQVFDHLGPGDRRFLRDHGIRYKGASQAIDELVQKKILTTGVPIKLQTMMEKRLLIKNFSEVVDWYNEWVALRGVGTPWTEPALLEHELNEIHNYHATCQLLDQQRDDALRESPRLTSAQ